MTTAQIQAAIRQAALANGVDPALALAVAQRESNFKPNATGAAGEVGVFQLTAAAAQDVGVNRYDPAGNILGGVLYLKRMLELSGGDEWLAVAAYNAGWSNASRGVIPASTQNYVAGVLATESIYASQIGGQPLDQVAVIPAPYLPQTGPEEIPYYADYVPDYAAESTTGLLGQETSQPSWSPAVILGLVAVGILGAVVLTQ